MSVQKTAILTQLALCTALGLRAQAPEGAGENIVPNPGFEEVQGRRPANDVDGSKAFKYNCVGWTSPTETTPDLILVPPSDQKKMRQGGTTSDFQTNQVLPHGGNFVVAILTDNPGSTRSKTYREYIQVELKKPMIANKEYYLEFWVQSHPASNYTSNNIGVLFTPNLINRQNGQHGSSDNGWGPLTDMKPDFNVSEVIDREKKGKWVKVSATVKTGTPAKYMTVGNFYGLEETKMEQAPSEKQYANAYYILDDFILAEIAPEPEPEPEPIPEPEPVVQAPPPPPPAKIKLDRVFFETAKWDLLPESYPQLEELYNWMVQYDQMEIEIGGHTDSRGPDKYNKDLSNNRARSIYNYLMVKGIAQERMKYVGFGEEQPIGDNNTEEGRQLNRRIEVKVTKINEGVEVNQETDVKPYTDKS